MSVSPDCSPSGRGDNAVKLKAANNAAFLKDNLMRKALLAAVVGAAMVIGASSASAATYISFTSPDSDGSISGVFGNDGGIAKGSFTNTFNFTWPVLGVSSGTISSSFTSKANDLNFTSVTLNGVAFASVIGGSGLPEFRFLTNLPVSAGPQQLVVTGYSPGAAATYSGTLSFSPLGAVPEPGTWALMIVGFGATGAMIRARRTGSALA
ncbi:FxDxF family PEP-CTERM protein [Phenylobacterium sp. LjRoot164]|uniref:FxDxF family PEP-CTERM protein n=1 Tax=unclassified Phenylobacterium TaxID=2640670 RepID=UPI003ECC5BDD